MSDVSKYLRKLGMDNYNTEKNSIRDARTPQPGEIILTPWDIEVLYQYKVQDTFRTLSVK